MSIDTGHGATLTFSGLTYNVMSISQSAETVADVDTSHLGVTAGKPKTYTAGDLVEAGEITVACQFDPETAPPAVRTSGTLTITWPISNTANSTNATRAGTAYLNSVKMPDMQTDTLQTCEFKFKWDGAIGPTYTAEAL